MYLFEDELVMDYMEWKNANKEDFSWWKYVNLKADIDSALAFAKFFYPDIIQLDGYFILKDKYDESVFESWKVSCNYEKLCVETMVNLYSVKDFFHINWKSDENDDEKVKMLGEVLQLFWKMSFKQRYPEKDIIVHLFEESDGELFITVYENLKTELQDVSK